MYHKRIDADIRHFKNSYPMVNIYQKDNNIVLENTFKCLIKLTDQYPFTEPDIYVIHDEKWNKRQLPYWTPIMDLRTIYAHVLSTERGSEVVATDGDKSPLTDPALVDNLASIINCKELDNDPYHNIIDNKDYKDDYSESNYKDDNETDPMFYVVDYKSLNQLQEFYPNVQITDNHHEIVIGIEDIEIFISINQVSILEMGIKWPSYMTPSYDKNVLTIVEQVMAKKMAQDQNNVKELKKSLEHYFDCVIYNPYHQTFIINCQQGLIMIGIADITNPTFKITMYEKGNIINIDLQKDLVIVDPFMVGKMIYEAIN